MQFSLLLERDYNSVDIKMKTVTQYKNPYKKESNFDNIVDQLCTRLQDIKDREETTHIGMPTCSLEQAEAVRRYYAAFPALSKGQEPPLQYYLPPPAWCRKSETDNTLKMQSELPMFKDWMSKNKKVSYGKERRNSYHGQKKNKKRCNSYSRSFESKENLPEWMTHEGVWDMETQDPVKEFIRAIALDEGYGTCENTVTDDIKGVPQNKYIMNENVVPDLEVSLGFDSRWYMREDSRPRVRSPLEEELYAKFEAKFDSSIEALWSKDQNTPDDEYQDLPIDFQDLLSSPSDHIFADPSVEKCSLISITESVWSNGNVDGYWRATRNDTSSNMLDGLHDRFKPLNLTDGDVAPRELESFSYYEGEDLYDAFSSVASTMRSFAAINHSRDRSGFVEVPPRRPRPGPIAAPVLAPALPLGPSPESEREDLLTAARTHFKPIRRETEAEPGRYVDGDTFDIRGELDEVEFRRSESGGVYHPESGERYLEYRAGRGIDYGRLNLTAAQRCPDLECPEPGLRLRFSMRQHDRAVQTSPPKDERECEERGEPWAACEECGRAPKKMRASDLAAIWSSERACAACSAPPTRAAPAPPPDELSRDWDELMSAMSAAHAMYSDGGGSGGGEVEEALVSAERKRRHSALLRGGGDAGLCSHPHARFLHCCVLQLDRPLTR